jgi:shikimate kinase
VNAPHLVLIGLMGAGKTTVGRRCAEELGRPFVDTDDLVVATAGASVPEIFAAEGETAFRARERAALANVVASPEPLVIACGGGAMVDAENRRAVRDAGFVVWLACAPAELAARVESDGTESRPLLAGGPTAATLTRLQGLRAGTYEQAADARVGTDGRDVDAVTATVLAAYRGACGAEET